MNEMAGAAAEYFRGNIDTYLDMVAAHVGISVASLAIAVAIGLCGAMMAVKCKRLEGLMSGIFQTLRVVPSLAVLILLIPIMGTGTIPAVCALSLLAIPPVFMNAVSGLQEIPPYLLENARGMGMTEKEIFRKVKWPMASPMILAGVKTAAIEIVASATLAAKTGAGGLGEIIFTGLGLYRMDLIVIGAVSVAVLSLMTGLILDGAEKIMIPWK